MTSDIPYLRAPGLARRGTESALVQEVSGIHVGISPDLPAAAQHAGRILKQHMD